MIRKVHVSFGSWRRAFPGPAVGAPGLGQAFKGKINWIQLDLGADDHCTFFVPRLSVQDMVSRAVSVFDSHINCVVLFHGVILSVVCEESRRAFAVIKGPVDSGVIKESRIDQSYRRIMRLKARLEE